ncbi:NADPH oxidase 5 [Portunus trituberculatus]|uniref:NADPH oxidase 5 n=1 Tax=Portunus trituberculatus TaxID=210409 RepID=A0A5B7E2Q9_PORTR|nr:NADPH oxidase 5 [Portunus trituberculatus]
MGSFSRAFIVLSIYQSITFNTQNTTIILHLQETNHRLLLLLLLIQVDFFWINRDQRSFEWFVNLLSQLEIEQAEQGGVLDRFLDMHMYITSALQKTDMKAVGLQLALDLLHEKEKRDLITGLKTRTNAGRPNWDKVQYSCSVCLSVLVCCSVIPNRVMLSGMASVLAPRKLTPMLRSSSVHFLTAATPTPGNTSPNPVLQAGGRDGLI